jgi:hypothetical protein
MSRLAVLFRGGLFAVTFGLLCSSAQAQIGFGVDSTGLLFRFDINAPSVVTPIGSVGFVPEGIDFRPGTNSLYALEVGPNTTQVYTIDITTAQATAVGAGFNSTGPNYNLLQNTTFGFDFNPKTLQPDNSMRIRVVGTNGTNLRLDSSTGQIAVVDSSLLFANGDSAFVDAAAYINNIPQAGGTTALYDMDSRNNALLLQNPPNNGTLTTVGQFGVTIDADRNIHFDIYTTPGDADPGIGGDAAYAVLTRPDAPINGPLGAYLIYNVNLATGQLTNGALVGPADAPYNFDGGFAIAPIPEPGSVVFMSVVALGVMYRVVRSRAKRA